MTCLMPRASEALPRRPATAADDASQLDDGAFMASPISYRVSFGPPSKRDSDGLRLSSRRSSSRASPLALGHVDGVFHQLGAIDVSGRSFRRHVSRPQHFSSRDTPPAEQLASPSLGALALHRASGYQPSEMTVASRPGGQGSLIREETGSGLMPSAYRAASTSRRGRVRGGEDEFIAR